MMALRIDLRLNIAIIAIFRKCFVAFIPTRIAV